jgi:hypothetical protein
MSWVQNISTSINNAFKAVRPPFPPVPPLLLLCELGTRPGLSAIALTGAIIQRLPEVGIPTGVNPDGSPNIVCAFVRLICEEIVKELKDHAKVVDAIEPGGIMTTGTGGNAGGPVVVSSVNTMITQLSGLLV